MQVLFYEPLQGLCDAIFSFNSTVDGDFMADCTFASAVVACSGFLIACFFAIVISLAASVPARGGTLVTIIIAGNSSDDAKGNSRQDKCKEFHLKERILYRKAWCRWRDRRDVI